MFSEANVENPSDEEIQVVEVIEEVEVVGTVEGAVSWLWSSLSCSNPLCSQKCDDVVNQGHHVFLSSCGHFYCSNCMPAYDPGDNYTPCAECRSLIQYLDKVALF